MSSKINELQSQELWSLFNSKEALCEFFDADCESIGEVYYSYDETALALAESDEGRCLIKSHLGDLEVLQLAACLNAFRLHGDDSLIVVAEQQLGQQEAARLRTAALDYLAHFLRRRLLQMLENHLSDNCEFVRVASFTWLVRELIGNAPRLAQVVQLSETDESALVREAVRDELEGWAPEPEN